MTLNPIWKASAAGLFDQLGPHTPDHRYIVAIDTSGGMAAFTIREILGAVSFLIRRVQEKVGKPIPVTVLQFDTDVRIVQVLNSPAEAVRIDLDVRGGSEFEPVSEYIRKLAGSVTAICITDGYFAVPSQIGKPEDRVGWFLVYGEQHGHLPGPQVVAGDSRWILMGDGPMLYNEEDA